MLENLELGAIRSQLDQSFCFNDNGSLNKKVGKKKRKTKGTAKATYSSIKVKARNFLRNMSYRRLKENSTFNISFITDCFSFVIRNFNPFFFRKGSLMALKIEN